MPKVKFQTAREWVAEHDQRMAALTLHAMTSANLPVWVTLDIDGASVHLHRRKDQMVRYARCRIHGHPRRTT